MHCVKLPGQRLAARDFDRQVAELPVQVAVLNGFTAISIPVTGAVGQVRPGKGQVRLSSNLCNRAGWTGSTTHRGFTRTKGVHPRYLLEPIGNIPPAEAEANFYAALETEAKAA